VGEADEATSIHSGLVYSPGFFVDDLFWGLLLPMDGVLKLYYDKSAYVQKFEPRKVIDIT
jgi:hypothetical protein